MVKTCEKNKEKIEWSSREFQEHLKRLEENEIKFVKPDEVKLGTKYQEICKLFSSAIKKNDQQTQVNEVTNDPYADKLIAEFQKLTTLEKDRVREIINKISEEELSNTPSKTR